jgi:hypothetical protein
VRVAGSYQVIGGREAVVMRAADAVLAFDGLHLVASRSSRRGLWAFLRCDGEVALADPGGVLADDLQAFIRSHGRQLRVTGAH